MGFAGIMQIVGNKEFYSGFQRGIGLYLTIHHSNSVSPFLHVVYLFFERTDIFTDSSHQFGDLLTAENQ